MAMRDTYPVLTAEGIGEFKDRGSKFFGFAHPARSESAAMEIVASYRKLHHKARHWCYAYRLGADQNRFRANDDGEPSGTAGRPILGQIDKTGVSDTVVVVVRYFGGVKLGTSGLINAYREAAALALAEAPKGERVLTNRLRVAFDYSLMGKVMNALNQLKLEMVDTDFGAAPKLFLDIPCSEVTSVTQRLLAQIGEVYLAEVDDEFEVAGLEIEVIT